MIFQKADVEHFTEILCDYETMKDLDENATKHSFLLPTRSKGSKRCSRRDVLVGLFVLILLSAGGIILAMYVETQSNYVDLPTACKHGCTNYSHSQWTQLLQAHVVVGGAKQGVPGSLVEYTEIRSNRRTNGFDAYLNFLKNIDLKKVTHEDRLPLFLNAYNVFAVDMVISNLCPGDVFCQSIRDVPNVPFPNTVWKWQRFNVGGIVMSLDGIEHGILRPNYNDARIHAAVNCASISCPDLLNRAYEPWNVQSALSQQTKLFLENIAKGLFIEDPTGSNKIKLSKIFLWFKDDFSNGNVATFLKDYESPKTNIKTFLDKYGADDTTKWDIQYLDYNWNLNGE
jgi:hypothetical protein